MRIWRIFLDFYNSVRYGCSKSQKNGLYYLRRNSMTTLSNVTNVPKLNDNTPMTELMKGPSFAVVDPDTQKAVGLLFETSGALFVLENHQYIKALPPIFKGKARALYSVSQETLRSMSRTVMEIEEAQQKVNQKLEQASLKIKQADQEIQQARQEKEQARQEKEQHFKNAAEAGKKLEDIRKQKEEVLRKIAALKAQKAAQSLITQQPGTTVAVR